GVQLRSGNLLLPRQNLPYPEFSLERAHHIGAQYQIANAVEVIDGVDKTLDRIFVQRRKLDEDRIPILQLDKMRGEQLDGPRRQLLFRRPRSIDCAQRQVDLRGSFAGYEIRARHQRFQQAVGIVVIAIEVRELA